MMAVLVALGAFMEWVATIFVTVPVFNPVVKDLAPEPGMESQRAAVRFGVLSVMNIQIHFLSQPFGPACFRLKSVVPAANGMPGGREITCQEVFANVMPFIALWMQMALE